MQTEANTIPHGLFADRYELVEIIGSGATSVVYEAIDTELLASRVAIKVLQNASLHTGATLKQLRKEAQLTRLISNPHVVQVYDFGQTSDGTAYLVMELIKGCSLDSIMKDPSHPMEATEIISIVAQILEGLAAAHAVKIGHRDLKPENILIDQTGCVKITDFGMGSLLEAEYSVSRTEESLGSPRYLAPEQLRGIKGNYQSDIFALGVIIFELLAGVPPFIGDTFFELALEQLHKSPPWERIDDSRCPHWLKAFAERCLEKDTDKRFSSAIEALAGITHHLPNSTAIKQSSSWNLYIKRAQNYYHLYLGFHVFKRVLVYLFARPQRAHASFTLWGIPIFYIALSVSQPIEELIPQPIDVLLVLPILPLYLRRNKRRNRSLADLILLGTREIFLLIICWSIVISARFDRAAWGISDAFLAMEHYYGVSLKPIKALYSVDIDPNDPDQFYMLLRGSKQNLRNKHLVRSLIHAGADLNRPLRDGRTAAMIYVEDELTDLREQFAKGYVDIGSRTPEGQTLFDLALSSDQIVASMDFARPNSLRSIDANRNIPAGGMILAGGIDRDIKSLEHGTPSQTIKAMVRHKNIFGQTLLHLAMAPESKFSKATIVNLLSFGADPNAKDYEGNTPALAAIKGASVGKVTPFLDEAPNLDVSIRDPQGNSLIWYAIQYNAYGLVERLVSLDPDFKADANYRAELLAMARTHSSKEMINILENFQ